MCDLECRRGTCVLDFVNSSSCVCEPGWTQSLEFALPWDLDRCAAKNITCLPCDTNFPTQNGLYGLAFVALVVGLVAQLTLWSRTENIRDTVPIILSNACGIVVCFLKIIDKKNEFGFSPVYTYCLVAAMCFWAFSAFITLNNILDHLLSQYQYKGKIRTRITRVRKTNLYFFVPALFVIGNAGALVIIFVDDLGVKYGMMVMMFLLYSLFVIYFMIVLWRVLNTILFDLTHAQLPSQDLKNRVHRAVRKLQVSKYLMGVYGSIAVAFLLLVTCVPPIYPYNKYLAAIAMFSIGALSLVKALLDLYWISDQFKSESEPFDMTSFQDSVTVHNPRSL